jgi:hypothetical protein
MFCQNCDYSLANRGAAEHRCPECGRVFDPSDASTFESASPGERAGTERFAVWMLLLLVVVEV